MLYTPLLAIDAYAAVSSTFVTPSVKPPRARDCVISDEIEPTPTEEPSPSPTEEPTPTPTLEPTPTEIIYTGINYLLTYSKDENIILYNIFYSVFEIRSMSLISFIVSLL